MNKQKYLIIFLASLLTVSVIGNVVQNINYSIVKKNYDERITEMKSKAEIMAQTNENYSAQNDAFEQLPK